MKFTTLLIALLLVVVAMGVPHYKPKPRPKPKHDFIYGGGLYPTSTIIRPVSPMFPMYNRPTFLRRTIVRYPTVTPYWNHDEAESHDSEDSQE